MIHPSGKTTGELIIEAEKLLQALWDAEERKAPQPEQAAAHADVLAALVPLVDGRDDLATDLLNACLDVGDAIALYLPWIRREAGLTTPDSCDYCPDPHEYRETYQGYAGKACGPCATARTSDYYRPIDRMKGLAPTRGTAAAPPAAQQQ